MHPLAHCVDGRNVPVCAGEAPLGRVGCGSLEIRGFEFHLALFGAGVGLHRALVAHTLPVGHAVLIGTGGEEKRSVCVCVCVCVCADNSRAKRPTIIITHSLTYVAHVTRVQPVGTQNEADGEVVVVVACAAWRVEQLLLEVLMQRCASESE